MRFTAITLLALGASTSAYVVPNNKVAENAVAARMPVSYPQVHQNVLYLHRTREAVLSVQPTSSLLSQSVVLKPATTRARVERRTTAAPS
jgi:hypothetical protein